MPSVLFVCTANKFRSPLAAACLLKNIGPRNRDSKWIVESAGTWARAGLPAPAIALKVAGQLGMDGPDQHLTRQIDRELLAEFDLILVMERGHREAICTEFPSASSRVYVLAELVDGIPYDIPDPADPGIDPSEIGRELDLLITKGKDKILQLAESIRRHPSPREKTRS